MKVKAFYFGFRCPQWGIVLLFLLAMALTSGSLYAQTSSRPILIISSSNPGLPNIDDNISEFIRNYKSLGGKHPILIQNMNFESLSGIHRWVGQMRELLLTYQGEKRPALIIILGLAAWSAFISQDQEIIDHTIPVLCGLMNQNTVKLPEVGTDLREWEPESVDVSDSPGWGDAVSGALCFYDINKNVELIKHLYPMVEHIAFLSDNSFAGVSIQALVKKQMHNFPELKLILLDGRKASLPEIIEQIKHLPPNTALLLGSWRIDMNDNYSVSGVLSQITGTNPAIPSFALTPAGMEQGGVIGGYIPMSQTIGKDLSLRAFEYVDQSVAVVTDKNIQDIPNQFVFDRIKMKQSGIRKSSLPLPHQMLNRSFAMESYKYPLITIAAVFGLLLLGYLIVFFYFFRVKKLKEAAEESDRLKSAFLANMSHEIRTPLNAIVGFANILVMKEHTPQNRKSYCEIIQNSSKLLLRLIDDILYISRLETENIELSYETCDIVELSKKVLETVKYVDKNNNEIIFDPIYPKFDLYTDNQRLQQILINLLSNALKFTKDGTITLAFEVDQNNENVLFSVTDTGCGIPVEKHKSVFERFEKLNEYAQGTGLGLAICKLIAVKWGGDIWIDPAYKDGTRFVFSHPLKQTHKHH
ncbi:MAG: sensor histidine kinase [Bacteroidales bacterium]|jgi:signal transduction histidine kinase|nr:sensor histidine kinase [Bacteroidales bacterium]